MPNRPRRIRPGGALSPDHVPRWATPLPRPLPFVVVSDTLITSFTRRSGGLRLAEREMVQRVVDHLAGCSQTSAWVDPVELTITPATFTDSWLKRRTADFLAVRLPC